MNMKLKFILFLFVLTFKMGIVKANQWNVSVTSFQFTPANINVMVGDTVIWTWGSGTHTTTSTSVPLGADSWDSPMDISNRTFQYVVTIEGSYNYWCSIHAPSMAGTITASAALPVVLSTFMISKGTDSKSALLKWSTSSEQNTEWFIVKKSINGSDYFEIGRVKAAGNSFLVNNYSFVDNSIGSSHKYIYYELQILSKDGSSSFSPVEKFVNSNAVKKLIMQISPNPVSSEGHLMLQFNADKEEDMKVELYDITGKLVLQTKMNAQQGINNGHLHLQGLSPGIYSAMFSMENLKETYRIVVE